MPSTDTTPEAPARRGVLLAGAGLAVALLLAGGWWAWRAHSEPEPPPSPCTQLETDLCDLCGDDSEACRYAVQLTARGDDEPSERCERDLRDMSRLTDPDTRHYRNHRRQVEQFICDAVHNRGTEAGRDFVLERGSGARIRITDVYEGPRFPDVQPTRRPKRPWRIELEVELDATTAFRDAFDFGNKVYVLADCPRVDRSTGVISVTKIHDQFNPGQVTNRRVGVDVPDTCRLREPLRFGVQVLGSTLFSLDERPGGDIRRPFQWLHVPFKPKSLHAESQHLSGETQ